MSKNITCCKIMDIFEVMIGQLKDVSENITTMNTEVPLEMKGYLKILWLNGAEHFSFLLADKLWKEEDLCDSCEPIYMKLKDNMEKYYPKFVMKNEGTIKE